MNRRVIGVVALAASFSSAFAQQAIEEGPHPFDPASAGQLSLEELMQVEVTSVAGVDQQLLHAPAAIGVITNEDIRRSGHRSIAEALRLSPGVYVGRSSSHRWSISPRGFNGLLANKTLVLEDGRRVYDPLFGGTFWEVQDPLLEDVDRIEVIRGPGPTLWGANAVNGVINVVTRSSKQTQGLYAEAGAGSPLERGFGALRYGGKLGDHGWFSAWGKYRSMGPLEANGPRDAEDDWDLAHGRLRTDFELDDVDLTFQADSYTSLEHHERVTQPVPALTPTMRERLFNNRVTGGHLLARAESFPRQDEGWSVLAYYDYTDRDEQGFEVKRRSVELDARYHFTLGEANALAAGVEYYFTGDDTEPSDSLDFDPRSRDLHTLSAFVQDTITIVPERLFAMIGSKFEHNDQTGFEVQPSGRVWWTPDETQTVWAAVSRPVRVPSRTELDSVTTLFYADPGLFTGSPTGMIQAFTLTGDDDLDAERIVSLEAGYRNQVTDALSVDVALFYSDYDDLISIPRGSLLGGASFTNDGSAETAGGEVAVNFRPAENWRLAASYSYVEVDVHGPIIEADEGNTPHSMATLTSFLDVTDDVGLNAAAYYVGEVPTSGIDDYLRVDVGATWRVSPNFELSVWGQNLLEDEHREASQFQVERGVYVAGTVRF
jgi:iron complex outermembrane receptor protein